MTLFEVLYLLAPRGLRVTLFEALIYEVPRGLRVSLFEALIYKSPEGPLKSEATMPRFYDFYLLTTEAVTCSKFI